MNNYLSPGQYKARAIASDIGVSNTKGTPFVSVTFEILEGGHEGSQIEWKGWSTEKAAERLVDDLRTLGYAGNDPEDLAGLGAEEVSEKLPNTVSIKVQDEEYNGNVRSVVRFINPLGRPAGASLFAGMKAAFAAKPAGKSIAKPNGGPRQRPQVADIDDDQVPF